MTREELLNKYSRTAPAVSTDIVESESVEVDEPELSPKEALKARFARPKPVVVEEETTVVEEEDEGPGFLKRSKDRLQLGASDWFSELGAPIVEDGSVSFPGEGTYGMSGDPTERDSRSIPERVFGAAAQPVRAVADVASDALGQVVPQGVKDFATDTMTTMAENKAESPIYADSGIAQASEDMGPRLSRAVGDAFTVGSAVAGAKLPALPGVGKNLAKRAAAAKDKLRNTDIAKRWQPDKVDEARGRIEQSKISGDSYEPVDYEKKMYKDLANVDDLDPRGGYKTNYNQIDDAVEKLRLDLDDKLKYESQIPKDVIVKDVASGLDEITRSETLIGNPKAIAIEIYGEFQKRLDDLVEGASTRTTVNPRGPGGADNFGTTTTTSGGSVRPGELLQLRRDMDRYINAKTTIDASVIDAKTVAGKTIRDKINAVIVANTKNADVAESLRNQSSLLTARDLIVQKANSEAKTPLSRVLQRTQERTGMGGVGQTGAAVETNLKAIPLTVGAGMAAFSNLGRAGRKMARLGGSALEKATQVGYEAGKGPLTLAAQEALRKQEEEK